MTALPASSRASACSGPGCRLDSDGARVLAGASLTGPRADRCCPTLDCLPAAERRRAGRAVQDRARRGARGRHAAPARIRRSCRPSSAPPAATATTATRSARRSPRATAQLSPTRFHNSVHNAPAGYWGIATGAHGPHRLRLCAYDASFAAGLLEALHAGPGRAATRCCWWPTTPSTRSPCAARVPSRMPSAWRWCWRRCEMPRRSPAWR